MAKYNLNKHTRSLFPWFWQNLTNLSLLDVIIEGLFTPVNDDYGDAETDYTQKVGYSIQRLSLETSLNGRFDSVLERITVQNGVSATGGFVYNEAELIVTEQEKFIFNEAEIVALEDEEFFFNEGETGGTGYQGFTVIAPLAIQAQESEIIAWIERVQIVGTDYTLTFI